MVTCYQEITSRYPHMTDEEIVIYARAGHPSATDYLIEKYRYLVEGKARVYFVAGADADDVIQEGMIGLFKAIRDYRPDRLKRFRAFADMCVTRQIITAIKSATRQKHLPLNDSISLTGTVSDTDSDTVLIETIPDAAVEDPAEAVTTGRQRAEFYQALYSMLSKLEAAVLEGYLAGQTYRQISQDLRCGTKCIDNALQRVKRKIAHLQQTMEGGPVC